MDQLNELLLDYLAEAETALEEPGPTKAPPEEPEPPPPPAGKTEKPIVDMGVRLVARSAPGHKLVNSIEILPPFELSV